MPVVEDIRTRLEKLRSGGASEEEIDDAQRDMANTEHHLQEAEDRILRYQECPETADKCAADECAVLRETSGNDLPGLCDEKKKLAASLRELMKNMADGGLSDEEMKKAQKEEAYVTNQLHRVEDRIRAYDGQ